jgi:hypothetical protein
MNTASEPTSVRLSAKANTILAQMKEDSYLAEMSDGYRLGIALALSQAITPPELPPDSKTFIAVSGLDPEQEIATAIRALVSLEGQSVYRYAERLADWGVMHMHEQFKGGQLDVSALIGNLVKTGS